MSRWRSTLCGSTIKSDNQITPEQMEVLTGQHSQILSCGGAFIPYQDRTLKQNPSMPTIHLANSDREFLAYDQEGQFCRFGRDPEEIIDDIDVIEEAFYAWDNKTTK